LGETLITVEEARRLLGVSKQRIAELIKSGALPTVPNPLDHRSKLLRQIDVLRLSESGVPPDPPECELFITWKVGGRRAHQNIHSSRVVEVTRSLTPPYKFSEVVRFQLDELPLEDGEVAECEYVMFCVTIDPPHRHLKVEVGDLAWPPLGFDPTKKHQLIHVLARYGPGGEPLDAEWVVR
jgi:hypothetical protein